MGGVISVLRIFSKRVEPFPQDGGSERDIGDKMNHCAGDAIIKFAGGVALGGVFSLLVFKRRSWPIVFGAGTGLGMAYANCQNSLKHPYLVDARRIKVNS